MFFFQFQNVWKWRRTLYHLIKDTSCFPHLNSSHNDLFSCHFQSHLFNKIHATFGNRLLRQSDDPLMLEIILTYYNLLQKEKKFMIHLTWVLFLRWFSYFLFWVTLTFTYRDFIWILEFDFEIWLGIETEDCYLGI